MSFIDIMHAYFRGERLEAWYFIVPVGAALVLFGAVVLAVERTRFGLGAAIPAVLLGLALCAVGLVVGLRTPGQVAALEQRYAESPRAMVAEELPRMEKVERDFVSMFWTFGGAAVLGLALIYGVRRDWTMGLGATLILAAGIGLLIDGFASRRATPYVAALHEISGELAGERSPGAPSPAEPAP